MARSLEGRGSTESGQEIPWEAESQGSREPEKSIFGMTLGIAMSKWRLILAVWISAATLSTFISFMLPKYYATESVFQVETGGNSFKLPMPEGLKMLDPKFKSSGTGIILAILDSRKLAITMVNSFDLKKRYKTKWEHMAIKKFRKNFESEVFDEGIIKISFTHPSPDTVKMIADSIISFVNLESIKYSTNKARFEYAFNKAIVDSIMTEIDSLSHVGIRFLNSVGVADFDKHVDISLKTYSKLQETLLGLESQFAVAKVENQKTPTELRGLMEMINILKKKEKELSTRSLVRSGKGGYNFGINYDSIPAMGVYLERLQYLVEKDKMIMKVMIPKLEDSRMRMIETTPMLNVIDPTYVPPYKAGPKRSIFIVLATFGISAAFLAFLIVWHLIFNPKYSASTLQVRKRFTSKM